MGKVFLEMSVSLDGFVAGPGPTLEVDRSIESATVTHLRYRVVR